MQRMSVGQCSNSPAMGKDLWQSFILLVHCPVFRVLHFLPRLQSAKSQFQVSKTLYFSQVRLPSAKIWLFLAFLYGNFIK